MPGVKQRIEIQEAKKRKAAGHEGLKESNLQRKLLHLWAMGKLSSTGLQELAHAATADGVSQPEMVELSALGVFGQHANNCHRDLLRLLAKKLKQSKYGGLKESPVLTIPVPALDPKEETPETTVPCHLVLPHLLAWQLFESYPEMVPNVFGLHKLKNFWQGLKKDDPRLWEAGLEKSCHNNTIPIWVHGDGVEFSTDSLMTFSWGPSLFVSPGLQESFENQMTNLSMDSSFLITAWPKSATSPETWPQIHEVITWSFQALWTGMHPEKDWKGEALPPKLERLARKPLTPQGYKFWVFNFLGDLEYYSNHLGFPHWSSHKFCWLCDCDKKLLGKNPFDFTKHPQWKLKPLQGLKQSPCTQHPLLKIPGGLPEYRVSLDVLHTIDLGVASRIAGSILHAWAFPPGCRKQDGPGNVTKVWQMLKEAYSELKTNEKFNNMTTSMFTVQEKPWSQPAKLKGHAGEIRHFIPVLAMVAWKKAHEEEAFAHMAECCHQLADFYPIISEDDFFMVRSKDAAECLKKSLQQYVWLKEFYDDGVKFTLTPKCHFAMHLADFCHYQNPRSFWTYKQESFMGYISTLGHSCSHGTRACKLSESFITKYVLALQLRVNEFI